MAETVDSLQIEIEASSTAAAGAIDHLTASLQRLGRAVKVPGLERLSKQMKALTQMPNTSTAKIEQEIARLEKQAEDSASSVLKLQKRLEGMQAYRGIGTPETAAGVEAEIQRTEKEIERLGGVIDAADNKIRQLRKSLETGMRDAAAPIEQISEALAKIPQVPAAVINDESIKKAAASCESLAATAEKAQKSLEGTSGSIDKLGNAAQKVQRASSSVDGVARAGKRVESSLGGAAKEAERLGRTVERAGDQGANGLDRLLDRLKRMTANFIIFRIISRLTSAVAENLGTVAAKNERVNETLSKIVTSVQYVVDALTAVVLPILTVIEPIVTAILDGIAEVLNFIARVVAAFTGQDTVLQATKTQVDFADSLNNTASSIGNVSSAAKEMKRQLLGIDELNIFDKPSSSGGGGLGDLRFEEIPNNLKLPDTLKSPIWEPNPVPSPEFAPVTLPELSGAKLKAPAWEPKLVRAPAFEPVKVPSLAGERLLSPEWMPNLVPSPVFEPVLLPDIAGEKLSAPVWEPGLVPSPVFEPVPIPDLVGELLQSPVWSPSVVHAPIFEELLIPDLVGKLLKVPEWMPSIIPAPLFEALTLPEWALSPLPVPVWSQNPILAPVLDNSPVLSGLAAMVAAFASSESSIGEKLQLMQQKFSSFVTATQTNLAAWGENIKANFSAVIEHIPKVTSQGLLPSAKTFGTFLTVTADALASWGPNVAENVSSVLEFIPQAVHDGLTAAGTPFVDWVNKTSSGVADWAENLALNAGKGISGFVQNFLSGLSAAWEGFVGFMKATGEKISGWWSANKHWAAPVGVAALAGISIGAFVLSGGAAGLAAIPSMAKVALPALAFADGGVVRSPTLGLVGEYPGARQNPEIIAPQRILADTIRQETDNSDVINAIFAMSQQIVNAINEISDRPINIDWGSVASGMTSMQNRQNMMYGKTLQNY